MPLSKVPRFCCIGAALFFNHSFYQGCVCFALNVSMASCTEQREERTLETPQYCCCVCIFLPLLHALHAAAASLLSGQHKALSDLAGHVWVLLVNPERDSVWDGLRRPGGAFFQIGFGCVMSHHHIEGLCTFLFKFWRENSKWRSCQQLVLQKYSL